MSQPQPADVLSRYLLSRALTTSTGNAANPVDAMVAIMKSIDKLREATEAQTMVLADVQATLKGIMPAPKR